MVLPWLETSQETVSRINHLCNQQAGKAHSDGPLFSISSFLLQADVALNRFNGKKLGDRDMIRGTDAL